MAAISASALFGHLSQFAPYDAIFEKVAHKKVGDTFQATGCSVDSQKPSHFSLALREQRCRPGKARFSIRPRERKGVKLNSLEGRTAVFRLIFVPDRSTVVE